MSPTSPILSFESARVVEAFRDYHNVTNNTLNAALLQKAYYNSCNESAEGDAVADGRLANSLRDFFRPSATASVNNYEVAYKSFLAGGKKCPQGSPGRVAYDLTTNYTSLLTLEILTWPILRYFLLSQDQRAVLGSDEETQSANSSLIRQLVMQSHTILTGLNEKTIKPQDYEIFEAIGEMIWNPLTRKKTDVLTELLTSKDRILAIKLLEMISSQDAASNEVPGPTFPPQFKELVRKTQHFELDQWRQTLLAHFEKIAEKKLLMPTRGNYMSREIALFPSEKDESDARFKSLLYLVNASQTDLVLKFLRIIDSWQEKPVGLLDTWIHITAYLAASNWLHDNQIALIEFIVGRLEMYAAGKLALNEFFKTVSPYISAFLDAAELKRMDEETLEQYKKNFLQRRLGKASGSGGASSPVPNKMNPPPSSAASGDPGIEALASKVREFEVISDVANAFYLYDGSATLRMAWLAAAHNTVGSMRLYYGPHVQSGINNPLRMPLFRMSITRTVP